MTTMLSARTILTLLVPLLAGTQMPLHAQGAGAKPAQGAPAPAPATPPRRAKACAGS